MKRLAFIALGLLFLGQGCSDRLGQMQAQMSGNWVLESRTLPDGTVLRPPQVQGAISWIPVTSRKAHVSLNREMAAQNGTPRRFDYAVSLYEISTSAITQARHILIRQGYRSSAEAPFSFYHKAKKAKGKISVREDGIEISHDKQSWIFSGDKMVASYDDFWTDTWHRIP